MNTITAIIVLLVKHIHVDYSVLPEKIDSICRAFKFIVGDRVSVTKYKNVFNKCYTEKCSKKHL